MRIAIKEILDILDRQSFFNKFDENLMPGNISIDYYRDFIYFCCKKSARIKKSYNSDAAAWITYFTEHRDLLVENFINSDKKYAGKHLETLLHLFSNIFIDEVRKLHILSFENQMKTNNNISENIQNTSLFKKDW